MASGFFMSMLMLSLTSWPFASGNVFRHGGKNVEPHSAEALPRAYYAFYAGIHDVPQSLPADASKPMGLFGSKIQSGNSRQVNSNSQPGSVSSYSSASVQDPRQQLQASLYQNRPGMKEPSSSQGEKRYGSSIVSSGAIMIHAPENPVELHASNAESLASDSGLLPQHPAFSVPAVLQTKEGMWDAIKSQKAEPPASGSGMLPQHPAFSVPAVLQTKEGMWDAIKSQKAEPPASGSRMLPQHPAFSVPAVLQTKEGMWDSIKSQRAESPEQAARKPNLSFSAPASQSRAAVWRSIYPPGSKAPSSTAERHTRPSIPVPQQPRPGQWAIYSSVAQNPQSTAQRHKNPLVFSAPVVQQNMKMWSNVVSPESSKQVSDNRGSGYFSKRLPSGQQQAQWLTRQPAQLGSPASTGLQRVGSNLPFGHSPSSSRPAGMESLYRHDRQQQQLSLRN